jgi:hypothetical protein
MPRAGLWKAKGAFIRQVSVENGGYASSLLNEAKNTLRKFV